MALPTALLAKGLAGVGIVAAGTTGLVFILRNDSNKEINDKIKKLGIDESCYFNTKNKVECKLNQEQVKAINFINKPAALATFQTSGLDTNKNLKLIIEKEYQDSDFPEGLRFTFTNSNNSEVKIGDTSNEIKLLQNTSYDFKIKTADDKSLKLEKAWDLTTLKGKAGVTCTPTNGNSEISQCDLGASINVWKDKNNYTIEASGASGKKVTVTKDTQNHNGGFKFTVSEDIALSKGTNGIKKGNQLEKLTQTNKSYEINIKDLEGKEGKKWFLVEKDTTAGS